MNEIMTSEYQGSVAESKGTFRYTIINPRLELRIVSAAYKVREHCDEDLQGRIDALEAHRPFESKHLGVNGVNGYGNK